MRAWVGSWKMETTCAKGSKRWCAVFCTHRSNGATCINVPLGSKEEEGPKATSNSTSSTQCHHGWGHGGRNLIFLSSILYEVNGIASIDYNSWLQKFQWLGLLTIECCGTPNFNMLTNPWEMQTLAQEVWDGAPNSSFLTSCRMILLMC